MKLKCHQKKRMLLPLILSTALAACGGSGKGGDSAAGTATVPAPAPTPTPTPAPKPTPTPTPTPVGSVGTWRNATGNLADMPSECGNLGLVAAQPDTNRIIAGVAQKGLWSTTDGGTTWTALGTGAGSAVITNRISAIVWDPEHPGTFWESGIYNGGGVYKTTNNGVTFSQVGNVRHNDSVSVDLTDPNRQTMLANTHETERSLWLSTNGGTTWLDIGASLPAGSGYCSSTLVLDARNFLVGCLGPGAVTGIYRSTNAGGSWSRVGTRPVSHQPLVTAANEIYWVNAGGGIDKSADRGASFTQVADGNVAAWTVGTTTMAYLPDRRIVTIGKDHLQISADAGKTWSALGPALPYQGGGYDGASGVTYSAMTKMFYIWRWTCGNTVPNNAIMSLPFDYEAK